MDRHQRLQSIIEELDKNKILEVDYVGKLLSISPATVRRDFVYLVKYYNIEKIWGGIKLSNTTIGVDSMLPLKQRRSKNIEAKKKIAKKAVSLIKDGDIIFIDGGTTTLEMVPHLTGKKIKIITNSILVAQNIDNLSENHNLEVFLTGGILYSGSGLVVGPQAIDYIKNFNADWTFLSIGGISEIGPTNSNVLVVETEKAMIKQSKRTVILADFSKIGTNDLIKIGDLKDFDVLITENNDNERCLSTINKSGIQTILV